MALTLGELSGVITLDDKPFQKGLDGAQGKLEGFGAKGKIIAATAGVAIGAAMAAGIANAMNVDKAKDKLNAQLGLTGKDAEKAGKSAGKLYAGAYGSSMEEVTGAVGAVMSSIKGMRTASEEDVTAMTAKVLDLAAAFEIDAGRAAQVAGQMITSGLAKDGVEAADLLAGSLQKVPAAVREDLMDAVDEYGPFMKGLGITGSDAMGMLVTASEKGMYGIDKTGDALKEFGIRATDMSKSTDAAYTALGLNTGDMTNALLAGGDTAKKAFGDIVHGLQEMKDPGDQAAAAIALFGTPLEDLSVHEIPKFLGLVDPMGDSFDTMKGKADELGTSLNDNASTNIETFRRGLEMGIADVLGTKVVPAINDAAKWLNTNFVPALQAAGQWIKDNQAWLIPLTAAVTGYVVAMGAMSILATVRGWVAAAAAAQWGLNAAMAANPIGLIVAGIAALVAGLVWFFTQTELGKEIWANVWAGIQAATKVVVDWFMTTALPIIQEVFRVIGEVCTWLYVNIIKPTWEGIQIAVKAVVDWFVNTALPFIQNVFKTVGAVFSWLYENIVKPVFGFISSAVGAAWLIIRAIFQVIEAVIRKFLAPAFQWFYNSVIKPVFDAVGKVVSDWWNGIVMPVFKAVQDFMRNVLGPAFDWLWKNAIKPAFDGIGSAIKWVWDKVVKPVFDTIKTFITKTIPDAFKSGVDFIKTHWDKIQAIAKAPVKFVVDTVINKGLIGAFNNIAGFLGIDKLPLVKLPDGFRNGGYTGNKPKGAVAGVVHGDEHVIRSEARRKFEAKHPGALDHLNQTGELPAGGCAHVGGRAAATAPFAGEAPDIWGRFQDSIRSSRRLFVSGNVPGWGVPAAIGAWNGKANVAVRGGRGNPQSTISGLSNMPPNILGYAFEDGGITLNTNSGHSPTLKRAVSTHEIGHVLGLPHTTRHRSIMHPFLVNSTQPTAFDVQNLRRMYGAPGGATIPGGGGGDGFNPVAGIIDDLVKKFKDMFKDAGFIADLAIGIGKKIVDSASNWVGKKLGIGGGDAATVYDGGGWLENTGGPQLVQHNKSKPDAVLSDQQWADIHKLALGNASGGVNYSPTYQIMGEDPETVMRRDKARAMDLLNAYT